jgi:hypothetical protein
MIYDQLTHDIAREFALFSMAVDGLYMTLRAPGATITPHAVNEFQRRAHRAAGILLSNTLGVLSTYESSLTSELSERPNVHEPLVNAAQTLDGYVRQIIDQRIKQLRGNGQMDASALLLHDAHGAVGKLLQHKLEQPKSTLKDTAGRTWAADKLVRTDLRHALYQAYLRAQVVTIAKTTDLAKLVYPDPEHTYHGTVLSISGQPGWPALDRNWNTVFHHHSRATLEPYVYAE